jgi:glycosyltransferase involved in cell wall biosynthesis
MMLTLSIVIPAYNEEEYLPACLTAIGKASADCEYLGISEIIVVDNASTDCTAEIAKDAGAIVAFEPEHRISKVRNAGAQAATGDFLLFIDADTVVAETALSEVEKIIRQGNCLGGGCYVKYDIGGAVAGAAWFVNHVVAKYGRAWGAFLFCQRAAFEEIGGFDDTLYGMEELVFSKALFKLANQHGLGFRIIPEYLAVTSGRRIKDQLRRLAKQPYVLLNPKKHMQNPDICRPVWYDNDRK